MAEALFGGLCRSGRDPATIIVAEPNANRRESLVARYNVQVTADNRIVADRCETCVVAVKPQVLRDALVPLAAPLSERRPLLVSVAAGITLNSLDHWSGGFCPIVRAMPNTPALIGCGAAALVGNERVSQSQRDRADAILAAVGLTTWLDDESLLDVVTALSGSGPAYFFLVMDALTKAGVQLGLDPLTARRLCARTALGAATLAETSEQSLEQLRLNVTSPGGTTERGIAALQAGNLETVFNDAVDAARARSVELAAELGEKE
ncbi:MAG: pyrroline-5-carboxylate reductase [Proteobacteria bacterium]|nr:MAG: pyrroline-5-carboxylate reductase [Pseudomonadota bacterium]